MEQNQENVVWPFGTPFDVLRGFKATTSERAEGGSELGAGGESAWPVLRDGGK